MQRFRVLSGASLVLAVLLLAACTPAALRTQPEPLSACMDALATGRLVADSRTGLGLADATGAVMPVEWPFGYASRREATGLVLLSGTEAGRDRRGARGRDRVDRGWHGGRQRVARLRRRPGHPAVLMRRAALLLLLVVAACSSVPVQLRTAAAPEPACDAGLASGVLVLHSETGLGLESDPGRVLPVIWPFGYSSRSDAGVVVLFDPTGLAVARVGDVIEIGGSVNKAGALVACSGFVRVSPAAT